MTITRRSGVEPLSAHSPSTPPPSAPPTALAPPSRLEGLDEIRGLGVALVMGFHIVPHFGIGWIGVQIFFVLSGFLITRSLDRSKRYERGFRQSITTFYIRRALRIFPLYFAYLGILSVGVVSWPNARLFGDASVILRELPWAWTYTSNISRVLVGHQQTAFLTHLWSLATEEQFYLLYPWFLLLCPRGKERWLLLGAILLGPVVRIGIASAASARPGLFIEPSQGVYFSGVAHIDAFAMGGLLHYLPLGWMGARAKPLTLIALVAIGALGSFALTGQWRAAAFWGFLKYGGQHIWGYSFLNLLAACLIAGVITHGATSYFGIFREMLRKWGVVSYGMYLLHFAIYTAVLTASRDLSEPLGRAAAIVLVPILTYLLASLSYRYFETPFLRLKDRWSVGNERRASMPALRASRLETRSRQG